MSEAQPILIDFDKMSFEEKRLMIIRDILRAANVTDFSPTLDWSTSSMQIHVPSSMVFSFVNSLDFHRICRELFGMKTPEEMFKIVFSI